MTKGQKAFLDELKESGAVNMFQASEYLAEAFDLGKLEAKEIVLEWMSTYD